jgi:glycosyltransferase involved in cell wall biosynthesis
VLVDFVINRYPPSQGGAEFYAKSIERHLRDRGYSLAVYSSFLKSNYNREMLDNLPDEEREDRLLIRRYRPHFVTRHDNYPLFPRMAFDLIRSNSDIIHGHALYYFAADVSALAALIRSKPCVISPYFSFRVRPRYEPVRNTMIKFVLSADVVLVLSEFERHEIEMHFPNVKRFETVPPAVSLAEFDTIRDNVFESRLDTKGKTILFFAGRLDRGKGIDILVKALPGVLRADPDVVCCIAGEDFGERERLEQLAKSLKVLQAVIFLGRLSRDELCSAFVNSDVFVFPSRYEAFGIVLIEAMAARTPIVASRCSAIPYVVEDGIDGLLFESESFADLTAKILLTLSQSLETESRVRHARMKVEANFTWERAIDKLDDVYRSLV